MPVVNYNFTKNLSSVKTMGLNQEKNFKCICNDVTTADSSARLISILKLAQSNTSISSKNL